MERLLLVSNRLPVTLAMGPEGPEVERSVGGLATGLREPHERSGGLWIGWPGPLEVDTEAARAALRPHFDGLGIVPIYLSTREVRRYYEGFANSVVWPLFHYLTGEVPLEVEGWDEYYEVNERFADVTAQHYRPGDLIWVHDYQLMLVPALLRKRLPDARIGFFLHIPFPTSELFITLPYREELLQGLLGADVIGFHTASYRKHFLIAVQRMLDPVIEDNVIQHGGRSVHTGVFPMGVDAASIAERAADPAVLAYAASLRDDLTGHLMLGIDRLDYTKGIPRRLLAFEQLLERRPEWRGQVRLLQIAVPSREGVRSYRDFRAEVNALVGRINGSYGTPHWMPVHYMYRSVPEPQLLGLYCAADVMLVTPVRDGMNLVAKEFVAARADEDGVLVLSEFAGAADELESAVQVNPYDIEDSAEAYCRALTMPRAERRERMRSLRATVFTHDVHAWVDSFLKALSPATPLIRDGFQQAGSTVSDVAGLAPRVNAIAAWPSIARRFDGALPVLFLDFDGTIARIVKHPRAAAISGEMRRILTRLAAALPIAMISGRSRADLMARVRLEGIIYAGSHGFDISGPGGLRHQVAAEFIPLIQDAAARLRAATADVDGVVIEEKSFSVAVHYRMVAHSHLRLVLAAVDFVLSTEPRLEKRFGKKVVEVRPGVEWDKGEAVRWIEAQLRGSAPLLPIYLGDDLTDEDAFASIGDQGVTVVVGENPRPSRAAYSLRNIAEVQTFLSRLADRLAGPLRLEADAVDVLR